MLLPSKVLCLECGGLMTMQQKHKLDIEMEKKTGEKNTVTRISETWRCHNGHLRMKNYNQEVGIKVS